MRVSGHGSFGLLGHGVGNRRHLLAWAGLCFLLVFQAYAYGHRLTLSLGPRVILQPWLMQRGSVLYEEIADIHTPLMPLILAALRPLVPDGLQLAKIVLVGLVTLSTLLTFLAAYRAVGCWGALGAAFFFVVWSPAFIFGKLWHESFLTPLYALLLWLYKPSASDRNWRRSSLLLGFLVGVAMLVKQHAAVVVAAWLCWNVLAGWHARRPYLEIVYSTALSIVAALVPLLAFAIYQYIRAGTLQGFLYWTLGYTLTSEYGSLAAEGLTPYEMRNVALAVFLVPVVAVTLPGLKRRGNPAWLDIGWTLVLLVASSVTAYPRFSFFHLQAALPALAWLSMRALADILRTQHAGRPFVTSVVVIPLFLWSLHAGSAYRGLLDRNKPQAIWEYEHLPLLAAQIEKWIGPEESVYIFPDDEGSANLYYLIGRVPPDLWIFHYPWYMLDWIHERILRMLENQQPEWVVHFPGRWEIERHAPEIIAYLNNHYRWETQLECSTGEVWLLRRIP